MTTLVSSCMLKKPPQHKQSMETLHPTHEHSTVAPGRMRHHQRVPDAELIHELCFFPMHSGTCCSHMHSQPCVNQSTVRQPHTTGAETTTTHTAGDDAACAFLLYKQRDVLITSITVSLLAFLALLALLLLLLLVTPGESGMRERFTRALHTHTAPAEASHTTQSAPTNVLQRAQPLQRQCSTNSLVI